MDSAAVTRALFCWVKLTGAPATFNIILPTEEILAKVLAPEPWTVMSPKVVVLIVVPAAWSKAPTPSRSLSAKRLKLPESVVIFALTTILFLAWIVVLPWVVTGALMITFLAALIFTSWANAARAWSILTERWVLVILITPPGAVRSPDTCTLPSATIFITPLDLTICVAFISPV